MPDVDMAREEMATKCRAEVVNGSGRAARVFPLCVAAEDRSPQGSDHLVKVTNPSDL
jgi:hypothetical protein